MCTNTHCTPIKFSKYYPTTNGKAGGVKPLKKLKSPYIKLMKKAMTLVIVFFAYKIMHNNF